MTKTCRLITILLTTCALASAPAFAQAANSGKPATDTGGATADASTDGDIVVTAQRRESSVQKTPLAITAIGGAELAEQGVRSPVELAARVPSLQIGTSGQIYLRGVGTANVNEVSDPTVATHVDGVYLPRPQGMLAAGIFDVARAEVLRGPQGTLYGRNATSGSINIISNQPVFEDKASLFLEAGNYDAFLAGGYLNVAASDTIALRAAFQTIRHDGYLTRPNATTLNGDSADTKAVRLQALYQPTDRLSVLLRGDYTQDGSLNNIYGSVIRRTGVDTDKSRSDITLPAYNNSKYGGVSGEINWEVGPGKLTYVGAYRETRENRGTTYLPYGGNQYYNNKNRTLQQELRYSGDVGAVSFVGGLFYFYEKNVIDVRVQSGPQPSDDYFAFLQNPVLARSYAAYGQATAHLTDTFRLTGGIRYTHDKKSRLGKGVLLDSNFNFLNQFATNDAAGSWDNVSWKAGVEYDVAPRIMLYADASTGFKAGGYYDGLPPGNTYAPEKVTAYEGGIKSRWLDNRLTVNIDAFYYDYRDLQVSTFADTTNSGVLSQVTLNAGKARSYGIESDISLKITPQDQIDLTVGYLNAKYINFDLPGGDQFSGIGNPIDYTGNQLAKAPHWTINGGYSHDFAIGSDTLSVRAQSHYESAKYLDYSNFAISRQGGFTRSDIMMTYKPGGKPWSVMAYVRNIENKRVWIDLIPRNGEIADGNVSAPRLYGVRVSYDF